MQHIQYEVWILVKKDVYVDEVMAAAFPRLGSACSYAEILSCVVNDMGVKKVRVYENVDCFRRLITSFDVKIE